MWPLGKRVWGYCCRSVARDWNIYGEGEVKFKKGRNEVDRTIAGKTTSDVARQKILTIVDYKAIEATPFL